MKPFTSDEHAVIADEGIYEKVSMSVWDDIIADPTTLFAEGRRTEGLVDAIERSGAILAEHFPPKPLGEDELPNHLIVLDAQSSA